MRKRLQQSFTCLTLFKPDIKELIWLFQAHLQEVEIVIDNHRILDSANLDQFDPAYQAQFLLARGQSHQFPEAEAHQSEPLRVEMRMSKPVAWLTIWKEGDEVEPAMIAAIRKVLLRRLNRVHQSIVLCSSFFALFTASSLQPIALSHHLDWLASLLLVAGGGLPLGLTSFLLLMVIGHWLKLDTRIWLFPGATETTRAYGRCEAIGTLMVALVLVVLVSFVVAVAFRLLWR